MNGMQHKICVRIVSRWRLAGGCSALKTENLRLPVHFTKKTFSLATGECLSGDECAIKTYPVKVEHNTVFIGITKDEGFEEALV
jgi:hypothetical protein